METGEGVFKQNLSVLAATLEKSVPPPFPLLASFSAHEKE